jgi:nitroimidazol reductase NimA-like FMN-containing flavoprotein (pyridoxamine 5'-phosphate oxidase superfamily)
MSSHRNALSPTARSTVWRGSHRARADREALYDVLDTALVCHLSFVRDGAPVVLPTGFGRDGDTLYLHGSSGARSLRVAPGSEVCVSVTVLDGVVYARAVFHFSMNYRSAVIHGRPEVLAGELDRLDALRCVTEHLAPGSWDHARLPNAKELAATTVLALDLTEAAVKVRDGGPGDEPEDVLADDAWAGVVPLSRVWGEPVPAGDLGSWRPVPQHVARRATPLRS